MPKNNIVTAATGSNIVPVIPPDYNYETPPTAISGDTSVIRLTPTSGTSSAPNQVTRFEIDSGTGGGVILDFTRAELEFEVTLTSTGGTYKRLVENAICTVRQFRVLSDTVELVNVTDFNLIAAFVTTTSISELAYTNVGPIYGLGSGASRSTLGNTTTKYTCPMYMPFLQSKAFPLFLLKDTTLVLEITWDAPAIVMEIDGTVPNYSLSNIAMMLDQFTPHQSYIELWRSRTVAVQFQSCTVQRNTFNSNVLQQDLNQKLSCVNSLAVVMRNQADIADPTVDDKMTTYNYQAGATWWVKHGNHYDPPQQVNPTQAKEAYWHLLRALGSWNGFNGGGTNNSLYLISYTNFQTNKFIMCTQLDQFSHSGLVNGRNLGEMGPLTFQLTQTASPSESQEVDFFIWWDGIMTFENGTVRVTN